MDERGRDEPHRPLDRLVAPVSRVPALIGIAYAAGVGGLAVTLVPGSFAADTTRMTAGLLLLFLAFVALFYLSVTVLETPENDNHS